MFLEFSRAAAAGETSLQPMKMIDEELGVTRFVKMIDEKLGVTMCLKGVMQYSYLQRLTCIKILQLRISLPRECQEILRE